MGRILTSKNAGIELEACQLLCARGAESEKKSEKRNVDGLSYQTILDNAKRHPEDWKLYKNM